MNSLTPTMAGVSEMISIFLGTLCCVASRRAQPSVGYL